MHVSLINIVCSEISLFCVYWRSVASLLFKELVGMRRGSESVGVKGGGGLERIGSCSEYRGK